MLADEHARLKEASQGFQMDLAPFVRDSALAYVENRHLIPGRVEVQLEQIHQAICRIESGFRNICGRTGTMQRLRHEDLFKARKLVVQAEEQARKARNTLQFLAQCYVTWPTNPASP